MFRSLHILVMMVYKKLFCCLLAVLGSKVQDQSGCDCQIFPFIPNYDGREVSADGFPNKLNHCCQPSKEPRPFSDALQDES